MNGPRVSLIVLLLALVALLVGTGPSVWEWFTTEEVTVRMAAVVGSGAWSFPVLNTGDDELREPVSDMYRRLNRLVPNLHTAYGAEVRARVRKWDRSVYHGECTVATEDGVVCRGQYDDGERVGIWTLWTPEGRLVGQLDYATDPPKIRTTAPWWGGRTDRSLVGDEAAAK